MLQLTNPLAAALFVGIRVALETPINALLEKRSGSVLGASLFSFRQARRCCR